MLWQSAIGRLAVKQTRTLRLFWFDGVKESLRVRSLHTADCVILCDCLRRRVFTSNTKWLHIQTGPCCRGLSCLKHAGLSNVNASISSTANPYYSVLHLVLLQAVAAMNAIHKASAATSRDKYAMLSLLPLCAVYLPAMYVQLGPRARTGYREGTIDT